MSIEDLSREQAIALLAKRAATRKLGLVWERDEIEAEAALNADFVALDLRGQAVSGAAPASNLFIQGDNYDALRWLRMTHRGRVKLIYIDPPYNTGNRDWIYNDHFVSPDDRFRHSTWLEFMHRRLLLARDLLAPDGAIFVSIDDNEGPYLKVLMDEVFGRDRFVTSFIWQKVDSPNDNKVKVAPDHEYIHCYASDEGMARWRRLSAEGILTAYGARDEQGRLYRDRLLRKNGKNSLRTDRPTMHFELEAPDGTKVLPIREDGQEGCWSHAMKGIKAAASEGRLIWKHLDNGAGARIWVPYMREFAPATPERPFPSIWTDVLTTRQAKAHHTEMFPGEEPFVTPKPEQLLARIIEMATNEGDLVLDFFLGSATTSAVATKLGRRWIGVERESAIADFAIRRLEKVRDGEQGGISETVGWEGGGEPFLCLETVRIPFEDLDYSLTPQQVWLTVQALHGLPMAPLENSAAVQVREVDGGHVAFCDQWSPDAAQLLESLADQGRSLVVYAYAPGRVRDVIGERPSVEIRKLPDDLVRRFGQ